MTNKDLIKQYVDTGVGIPEYQFNKLPNWAKKTYLRKIEMSLDYDIENIRYYYGELPKETQLKVVNEDSYYAIQHIKNPSEEVQLVAVNKDYYAIQHIENPSERVQLVAVNLKPRTIRYIENPTERVQIAAVNNYRYAIQYIENPSEKVVALWKELYG